MTSPPAAGTTVFGGRYVVERPLGAGGTATVYLCRDRTTMNAVAVKLLHLDLAESMGAARFLREIRLTEGLDHPSILPVIDSGTEGSQPYCVLPYMDGGTLRDLLREKKQLAIGEAVEIASTIADALAYAHDRGLIHRDIKPENILFHQGKAYLGDFGIARALHATSGDMITTTTGVIRGTPAYMSPEQASGERRLDARSDVYSLAGVVYEMISGMPPFIGPTQQSVLAQRFSTAPREMKTYRDSVSPALDQVVAKAMSTAPADRFQTSRDFVEALDAAATAAPRNRMARRRTLAIGIGVLIVTGGAMAERYGILGGADAVAVDTTQLAVFPFERQGNVDALGASDALIYTAFATWRGVSVLEPFRIRDALLKARSVAKGDNPRDIATSLGAGRYVRGEVGVLPAGSGWLINASLYDVRSDEAIKTASITVGPAALGTLGRAYRTLAGKLLLPEGAADSVDVAADLTDVLSALQAYAEGVDAVSDWDFPRADSLFQQALDRDPAFVTAALAQAHVRLWQRADARTWAPLAARAIADSAKLGSRDRELAAALAALGAGRFDESCARYRRLTQRNQSDFAAWFGLAQCQDRDYRVVKDANGWRYRSSFEGAMRAYQRAFDVLALSHRSMKGAAFQPLRELLAMRPSQLRGAIPPEGDTTRLFGRLDMAGDSLVMRPVPAALVNAGDPKAVPVHLRGAIRVQQQRFRAIAERWATALPRSAGAKEAVAIGLEMSGDPAALDTLRRARALAPDSLTQLRLAMAELALRLKHLRPGRVAEAVAIRRTADSILRVNVGAAPAHRPWLAFAATIVGDCESAGRLLQGQGFSRNPGVDPAIVGDADAVATRLAMGCSVTRSEIMGIRDRVVATAGYKPEWVSSLLGLSPRIANDRGMALDSTLADPARDPFLRAQAAGAKGDGAAVRAMLTNLDVSRSRTGYDDVRPEAIQMEAHLALQIGDTAHAVQAIDAYLGRAAFLTPGMLIAPPAAASLIKIMSLRGTLAVARREPGGTGWGEVTKSLPRSGR